MSALELQNGISSKCSQHSRSFKFTMSSSSTGILSVANIGGSVISLFPATSETTKPGTFAHFITFLPFIVDTFKFTSKKSHSQPSFLSKSRVQNDTLLPLSKNALVSTTRPWNFILTGTTDILPCVPPLPLINTLIFFSLLLTVSKTVLELAVASSLSF